MNLPFLSNRLECSASNSCVGGTLTQAPYSLHCTASNQNMSLLEPLSMWYHTVNIFPWTTWQRNCACVSNTPEVGRNNMARFAERITTDNSSSNTFVSRGRKPVLSRSPRPDRCNQDPGVHSYERNRPHVQFHLLMCLVGLLPLHAVPAKEWHPPTGCSRSVLPSRCSARSKAAKTWRTCCTLPGGKGTTCS